MGIKEIDTSNPVNELRWHVQKTGRRLLWDGQRVYAAVQQYESGGDWRVTLFEDWKTKEIGNRYRVGDTYDLYFATPMMAHYCCMQYAVTGSVIYWGNWRGKLVLREGGFEWTYDSVKFTGWRELGRISWKPTSKTVLVHGPSAKKDEAGPQLFTANEGYKEGYDPDAILEDYREHIEVHWLNVSGWKIAPADLLGGL